MIISVITHAEMLSLPQTSEYALRAALHIGRNHPQPVSVAALAAAVGAPENYLGKTLGHLVRAGVLISTRGPRGGFRLAEPPESVSLARVVAVFRDAEPARCLIGAGRCGDDPDCPVHARWRTAAAAVGSFFTTTTIADLIHPCAATAAPVDTASHATSTRTSRLP